MARMRSALSSTLIVCLVASALPVSAQDQTERPRAFDIPGSISQVAAVLSFAP